jgi:hypothetical protein
MLSDDDEDIPALAVVDPLEEDEDESDSEAPNDAANFQESEPRIHDADIDIPMDVSDLENGSNGAIHDEGGRHYEEVPAQRWGRRARTPSDSDDSDDETSPNIDQASDVPQEDLAGNDEVDIVDWDALERECGLSAWNELGEKYEADAAGIGTFYSVLHFNALLITP